MPPWTTVALLSPFELPVARRSHRNAVAGNERPQKPPPPPTPPQLISLTRSMTRECIGTRPTAAITACFGRWGGSGSATPPTPPPLAARRGREQHRSRVDRVGRQGRLCAAPFDAQQCRGTVSPVGTGALHNTARAEWSLLWLLGD